MGRISEIVKHLIIINVIFYIASQVLGDFMYDLFAMHYPKNPDFILWQPLTHMFMHGNLMHLAFNMLALWMFGSTLANIWGTNKFIFFYLSSGLGAAVIQMLAYYLNIESITSALAENGLSNESIVELFRSGKVNTSVFEYVSKESLASVYNDYNSVMVGASGAIYGVLVAFTFMFPNSKLMLLFPPIPVKAKYLVPIIILGDVFFGFTSASIGPIAHFAHLGGAITGFLMMWYWKKNQFNNKRWN